MVGFLRVNPASRYTEALIDRSRATLAQTPNASARHHVGTLACQPFRRRAPLETPPATMQTDWAVRLVWIGDRGEIMERIPYVEIVEP